MDSYVIRQLIKVIYNLCNAIVTFRREKKIIIKLMIKIKIKIQTKENNQIHKFNVK